MPQSRQANSPQKSENKEENAPSRAPSASKDRLTQKVVSDLAPAATKLRLPDHEVRGLFLRVTPSGAKSYVLRYSANGRRGEAAIGDARSITLVAARAKAIALLNKLAVQDIDPVAAKRKAVAAERQKKQETFAALTEAYRKDSERRKRPKTLSLEAWLLDRHILPRLGARRYADLRRGEIIAFVEQVGEAAGAVTGNRAHGVVRQVLNFALKRDLIAANPALGIERVFPEASRERVLSEEELRKLWAFLEAARGNLGQALLPGTPKGQRPVNGLSWQAATALQLCLITLQRAGEVVGAKAEEFSWTDKLWIIPANRMKGKRAHAVPLSDLAMQRFQAAFARSDSAFAFLDRSGEASLDPKRLTRAMARCCKLLAFPSAGAHDLRRTGRTMITSERVGVSYETAERIISHLVGSSVSRVYDRNEYLREKRAALEAWARELQRVTALPNGP
ncbi:MAG: tyrosine-type recombinase/integrase [Caulobacterales bacterium]